MQFFIDTVDVAEIREAQALGILDGVTTNPSLVAKSGRDFEEVAREILELVDGPASLEVTALDTAGMLTEAAELAGWGANAVINPPPTPDGPKACKTPEDAGTRPHVTLCFSANQALLAAKAGASYVSPFIGRLDGISEVGMDLIHNMRIIFDNYDFRTQILAASIRNPVHVLESALAGADVATIPFSVFNQLVKHPLTDIGLANFLADWEKRKQ